MACYIFAFQSPVSCIHLKHLFCSSRRATNHSRERPSSRFLSWRSSSLALLMKADISENKFYSHSVHFDKFIFWNLKSELLFVFRVHFVITALFSLQFVWTGCMKPWLCQHYFISYWVHVQYIMYRYMYARQVLWISLSMLQLCDITKNKKVKYFLDSNTERGLVFKGVVIKSRC